MCKDWFKNLVGFNLFLPLLAIGLSFQLIRLIREEKWVFVAISIICIIGLFIQMFLGYRSKARGEFEKGQ